MKLHPLHRSRALRRLLALAAVATMALGALTCPTTAMAKEATVVAHSGEGDQRVNYTDVDAALEAGSSGKVIVMDTDWIPSKLYPEEGYVTVLVKAGQKITIDMAGHTIGGGGTAGLCILDGGECTLMSSVKKTIAYDGVVDVDGNKAPMQVTTGGLLTSDDDGIAALVLNDSAKCTLDGVAVAGSISSGVLMYRDTSLEMKGEATIEHNLADSVQGNPKAGGGICATGTNASISMTDSSIHHNYGLHGGGVFLESDGAKLTMTDGAAIQYNTAETGGGVYAYHWGYTIKSPDGSGCIKGNSASGTSSNTRSGGGIYLRKNGSKGGRIEGINIADNHSVYTGGGIQVDQSTAIIKDCTITGNSAGRDGGGVYVNNEDAAIEGCTITGNYCNDDGGSYEGGGVYIDSSYDIELGGTCVIKGNTRGKDSGNADDVMLRENGGGSAKAYITGTLESGSSVGVRTGYTSDRMVAKSFKPESKDCLFADLDGYFVTYGSDHDGDAWQRKGTRAFSLKVDGAEQGRYAGGSTVTATAKPAPGKFFVRWDAGETEGLNPVGDYIADSNLYSSSLSFKMPQNDVGLVAVYADETSAGTLTLAAPKAGEELPTEATFSPKASGGSPARAVTVKLAWHKVVDGGKTVAASGVAEYGATYFAEAAVDADRKNELVFADQVFVTASTGSVESTEVRADGSLLITTGKFETDSPAFVRVEDISLTFAAGTSRDAFMAALPEKATAIRINGTTQQFEIDWSSIKFDDWFDASGLKANMRDVTYPSVALKDPGKKLPEGMRAVSVSFAFTPAATETVAVPEVTPAAGTYGVSADSAKFDSDGTKMTLTATCATDGAKISYTLSRSDGSEWKVDAEDAAYGSGIDLPVKKGGTVSYRLEIRAVKGDARSKRDVLYYTIEDDRAAETVDVTVKYADTAVEGSHGSKKDDVHEVVKGQDVTLVAPDRDGYAFEKWTVGGEDRTGAALALEKVDADTTVTAVYNPVVTELDVDFAAPVAHEALAASATVKAKAGDSDEAVDITGYFEAADGGAALSWAPEGDSEGRAEHMAVYTASLALRQGKTGSGVKYVLPDGLSLRYGGHDLSGAAYTVDDADGAKRLCVLFESTGPLEEPELAALGDVELTHEQARGYQTSQDAGGSPTWSLPKEVTATCKCGCEVALGIDWDEVTGFKKDGYAEQVLTAKGEASFPSYVDNGDGEGGLVSGEVTVKVKVAAAEAVERPTASLKEGKHKGTQKVELSCETDDVTIRYTTDGSEPTEESPVYGGWIEVAESATVKARAFRDGWKPSETLELAYEIVHDVTFDAAGGSAVEAQEVEHGACVAKPANPVLAGCAFEGWYAEGAEDAYDFSKPVTADLELHARWSAKGEPVELHAVTFDPAGGTEVPEQHVAHGGCATRPADPELDGFEFEGWLTEDGEEYDFSAKVTSDVALRAQWSRGGEAVAAHMVTFDSAGGTAVDAQTVADGACAKEPGAPTLEGFDFEGWCAEGAEAAYDFSSRVTSDIALYARWSANGEAALAHLVVFDAAGGTAVPAQTVADGETVERPADPTRKGHEFQGWYAEDSKDAYDFETRVTDDLILHARWSAKGDDGAVEHLVAFDSAGGTPVASQSVADGQRAEHPADPTRAGYDFAGWTLDGRAYDFSTPVKGDLKLTATWKKQESKKDDTEKDDGDKDDSGSTDEQKGSTTKTTAVTTVTTSTGSTLAATGDRTPLIVGALVALGLLAAAAGILAKRKEK